jgi:hypothetical protein
MALSEKKEEEEEDPKNCLSIHTHTRTAHQHLLLWRRYRIRSLASPSQHTTSEEPEWAGATLLVETLKLYPAIEPHLPIKFILYEKTIELNLEIFAYVYVHVCIYVHRIRNGG